MTRSFLIVAFSLLVAGSGHAQSRYLYVWAGAADHEQRDFLAVVDALPTSRTYGQVINTVPVAMHHSMPHHIELTAPKHGPFFASGFMAGKVALFDFTDRMNPTLSRIIDSVPKLRAPHSFLRLASGNVLATVQFGDSTLDGNPGGLAEFAPNGDVVRTASSADPANSNPAIRTYALDHLPAIDRLITTSSPMDSEKAADVIQVWELSTLKLLRTIALPERADSAHRYPFEVKAIGDDVALMNTYHCGFYYIDGLRSGEPRVEHVLTLKTEGLGCGVPLVIGKYWLMPVAYASTIVVLDISDPRQPREVSRLNFADKFDPHWVTLDPRSDRVVVSGQGDQQQRVYVASFSQSKGELTLDEKFRDEGSTVPGINFDRMSWPHGPAGKATPHGAIFID
jgi:hypothetical protein